MGRIRPFHEYAGNQMSIDIHAQAFLEADHISFTFNTIQLPLAKYHSSLQIRWSCGIITAITSDTIPNKNNDPRVDAYSIYKSVIATS
jgi:hypothetical protein